MNRPQILVLVSFLAVLLVEAQLDPRKARNAMERPVGMPVQRQPAERMPVERQPVEQAVAEGGRAPVRADDPIVIQVASFAVQKWSESANSLEGFKPGRIAAAFAQPNITPDGKDQYDLEMEFNGEMGTTRFMHIEVARASSGTLEMLKVETLFKLKVTETPVEAPEATQPGLVGSYEPSRIDTPEIRTAAIELARNNHQLEAGADLVLCKASTQVVAGMNYQLDIGVGGCEDSNAHFKGRVFRSLQNQFQVSISP